MVRDGDEAVSNVLSVEQFDPRNREDETHRWLSEWSMQDDLGTDYRLANAGGGGTCGEW